MSVVTIYGSSDDLIEIEGTEPGCDEYNADDAHFVLIGPEGQVRIRVWYGKRGVWIIAAAPVEEDAPMLPLTIQGLGYSAVAIVAGVDSVIREHE